MGRRLVALLLTAASVGMSAGALAMVRHVPASAYVVPTVRIASAEDPVRLSAADLGAVRTEDGLVWDEAKLQEAARSLSARYTVDAVPGTYELTDGGVLLREGTPGTRLDPDQAKRVIIEALSGRTGLSLPVEDVPAPAAPDHAIVVRLSDFRLELFQGTELRQHFVVGVGALRFPTPPGAYYIRSKAKNPTWRNPMSGWSRSMPRFIPPGPKNPLGTRALRLDRGAIVIHGTPNPSSVGQRSSHGCIRMRKADVEALFEMVPEGTPVFIIP